jgi:ribose 5-phosphate isomerase A
VSTSTQTTQLAKSFGIEIIDFNNLDSLELVIDGADEVDPHNNLIKGGGGALLMEKIVGTFAKELLIIADETKIVNVLGKFPLPVEIVQFGSDKTKKHICALLNDIKQNNFRSKLRKSKKNNFLTDESNFILDLHLNEIKDPYALSEQLLSIPGVIEVGLFLDMASTILIGRNDYTTTVITGER